MSSPDGRMSTPANEEDWQSRYEAKEEQYQVLKREFQEYQESSQQIEEELERELAHSQQSLKGSQRLLERSSTAFEELQQREQRETEAASAQMVQQQRELEEQAQTIDRYKQQFRELEQEKDDLERKHRAEDLQHQLDRQIEQTVFVTHEFEIHRTQNSVDVQRLRDLVRDLTSEVKAARCGRTRANSVELMEEAEIEAAGGAFTPGWGLPCCVMCFWTPCKPSVRPPHVDSRMRSASERPVRKISIQKLTHSKSSSQINNGLHAPLLANGHTGNGSHGYSSLANGQTPVPSSSVWGASARSAPVTPHKQTMTVGSKAQVSNGELTSGPGAGTSTMDTPAME